MAYLDENGLEYVLEKLAAEGKSKNADYATTAGSASSCTGNAATATKATSADSATTAGTCTGNAATATTATTANKVKGTLTIQGNGTTLTNGTYNGSANKTVNITPASIGAQVAGDYAAASHSHDAATNSASGFMTPAMVTKLNGIADNANNYSLPTASSSTLGGVKTTNTTTDVSTYTACPIVSGVPYYKDTNDKYTHPNSGVTAGTYNKVQVNAQGHVVSASNEYSFKSVKVGNVSVDADSSIDTLVLAAGDNITITPDATSDKITIAATDTVYTLPEAGTSLGGVKSGGDVTISGGTITVNDDSHNHVISNVDGLQTALDSKSNTGHAHAGLVNGAYPNGVVNLLYVDSDTFMLVPRQAGGSTVETYLGDNNCRYAGTYTDFLVATNNIQADSGNIVAANGLVQAKTQVYSKGTLTADGALSVGGAATIDGTLNIGGVVTTTLRIVPAKTNNVNLGLSERRWMGIYSATSVNVASDLNVKKDLAEIDDRYIRLFDLVQPYAYRFIDGNSGRVHTGFISQYVEQAMEQVGLTAMDLGFFCKDALFDEVKDEDGNVIGQEPVLDEDGNQKYFYSLRYEEYIAIMTEKIKRMEKRIDELETKLDKVDEIESRLAALEA